MNIEGVSGPQNKMPMYANILAVVAGIATLYLWVLIMRYALHTSIGNHQQHFIYFILVTGALFVVAGVSFGFAWPNNVWRLGVLVSLPFLLAAGFVAAYVSLVYYNPRHHLNILRFFALYPLPLMGLSVLSSYVGTYLGARLSRRRW
jgi:hypothetical protein